MATAVSRTGEGRKSNAAPLSGCRLKRHDHRVVAYAATALLAAACALISANVVAGADLSSRRGGSLRSGAPTPAHTGAGPQTHCPTPSPGPSPSHMGQVDKTCPTPPASPTSAPSPKPTTTPTPAIVVTPTPATVSVRASAASVAAVIATLPGGTGEVIKDPALITATVTTARQAPRVPPASLLHFTPVHARSVSPTAVRREPSTPRVPAASPAPAGLAVVALIAAVALWIPVWVAVRRAPGSTLAASGAPAALVIVLVILRLLDSAPLLWLPTTSEVAVLLPSPGTEGMRAAVRDPSILSVPASSALPRPEPAIWTNLVYIEQDIVDRGRALADVDTEQAVGEIQMRGDLNRRQLALMAYQNSLQQEVQFYTVVARDSTLRRELTEATAWTPTIGSVVAYDLTAVLAQLRQDQAAAVSAAPLQLRATPSPAVRGVPRFRAPVGGIVSQGFGPTSVVMEPSIVYAKTSYDHFHTGIDIANVLDTPVAAAAAGRVVFAGTDHDPSGRTVGYGNFVVIDNGGGYISLYGHLDQLRVTTGQRVQSGQEIGLLGTSGWSTGPHLHFEIRLAGVPVDPEPLLGDAVVP
jgi:murein DD-endopeptidase MepM/ murein hydrolase activator NlpD